MTGLLKNDFYAVAELMGVGFILIIGLGAVLLISGDVTILIGFTVLSVPAVAIISISGFQREGASKWGKHKLTFPVRRADIVKSQYINHALWSLLGLAAVSAFVGGAVLIHGNIYFYYGFRDAITLILTGGVLAFLIGSISYPLYYALGADKATIVTAASVLGSIGIVFGLSSLMSALSTGSYVTDSQYYGNLAVIVGATAAIYLSSFFIAVSIFKKREY